MVIFVLCTFLTLDFNSFTLLDFTKCVSILNIMAVNAEVVKTGSENNLSLIRKFTKRVQGAGILPRLRKIRYSSRKQSEYVKKKMTLKRLAAYNEMQELFKMGKSPISKTRRK